ncbi:MAG: acyltransferase [Cytophagales bacterium]|nr:acyltransferase [Rhizobacter sp.]
MATALPHRAEGELAASAKAGEASMFDRLALIRLPLIVLVVCYHNESGGAFVSHLQGAAVLQYIVNLVANGLGGIRVPVFFLIAGYVFFRNRKPGVGWFAAKIGSRARSVLLPLILWSLLWLVIVAIAQELSYTAGFFSGKSMWSMPVSDYSLGRVVWAVFGTNSELFLYHLWFLRDLFVLVLLSPLIHQLIRISRGWVSLALLLLWLLDVDNGLVSKDALFFFIIGCHLAIAGRSIFWGDMLGPVAILGWVGLKTFGGELHLLETKAWILCGTLGALYVSGFVQRLPSVPEVLRRASRYSFLVFVAHEPLLTVVRRVYFDVLEPVAAADLFVAYFAIVAITVSALIVVFCVAERLTPRLLDVMTGGRASA